MKEIRPIYWIGILCIVVVGLFFMAAYMFPSDVNESGVKLNKGQEKAVQANLGKEHQTVEAKTNAGAAELKAADKTHVVVTDARAKAISAHIQSRSHATPTPTVIADTTAARIQSRLADYGN